MNFYGINYLQTQSNINDYLKYVIIFSTLFVLIVVFSLYMRHRLQTRYRDLTIIAFCFCCSFQVFSMQIMQTAKMFTPSRRKWLTLSRYYQKKRMSA